MLVELISPGLNDWTIFVRDLQFFCKYKLFSPNKIVAVYLQPKQESSWCQNVTDHVQPNFQTTGKFELS
jgi:hypothetical protein